MVCIFVTIWSLSPRTILSNPRFQFGNGPTDPTTSNWDRAAGKKFLLPPKHSLTHAVLRQVRAPGKATIDKSISDYVENYRPWRGSDNATGDQFVSEYIKIYAGHWRQVHLGSSSEELSAFKAEV
ncbi:Hypothetical protein D9617_1g088140 [Elsinoe fawcettii]|nr:Hypothetical protein D9617_1g088140 [Elsinoe fawcettii]